MMKKMMEAVPKTKELSLGCMVDFKPLNCEDIAEPIPDWVFRITDFLKEHPINPIQFKTDDTFDQISVKINGQPLPHISGLAALCHPSPYGDLRNATTKVDESIRKSLEITPEDGLEVEILDQDRLREIVSPIFPGKKIGFKVNKMVLYRPGDFFKPHQDTPRDGIIGTLVILVPDYENEPDSEAFTRKRERNFFGREPGGLHVGSVQVNHRLVAFYPTLSHSVEPMNRSRAVVTFYITDEGDEHFDLIAVCSKKLVPRLPSHFGLILFDRYSLEEIQRKGFRGIDQLMYRSLLSRYDIITTSVLVHEEENWDYENDAISNYSTRVFLFDEDVINFCLENHPPPHLEKFDPRPIEFCVLSADEEIKDLPGTSTVMTKYEEAIEYTGNESRPGILQNLYFATAFVLSDSSNHRSKKAPK